jgi:hypothetical protein
VPAFLSLKERTWYKMVVVLVLLKDIKNVYLVENRKTKWI